MHSPQAAAAAHFQEMGPKRMRPNPIEPESHSTHDFPYYIFPAGTNAIAKQKPDPVMILISIPSPSDECPITALPISDPSATSDLTFIPEENRVFRKTKPRHTKATLECGHGFSAMHLVYYWAKTAMRCPCCREGSDKRAAIESLPFHFRHDMARKIEASEIEETNEAMEEDRRTAMLIATGSDSDHMTMEFTAFLTTQRLSYTEIAGNHDLNLKVTFFDRTPSSSLLRIFSVVSATLRSDPEEGRNIEREIKMHIDKGPGARSVLRFNNNGNEIEENDIFNANRTEMFSDIHQRSFTTNQSMIRNFNTMLSRGLHLIKFSVVASVPGSLATQEIEVSQKFNMPPLEKLRNARLVISGTHQPLQGQPDGSERNFFNETMSQFYVDFSDEETPSIVNICWVPRDNDIYMHSWVY